MRSLSAARLPPASSPPAICSLKDILYKKRMERELLRAKGLLKEAEKAPDEVPQLGSALVLPNRLLTGNAIFAGWPLDVWWARRSQAWQVRVLLPYLAVRPAKQAHPTDRWLLLAAQQQHHSTAPRRCFRTPPTPLSSTLLHTAAFLGHRPQVDC